MAAPLPATLSLFTWHLQGAYIKSSKNTFETGQCNVVPTFSALYRQNDDAPDASNKKISDHLPLWAEFKVNELTQALNAAVKRVYEFKPRPFRARKNHHPLFLGLKPQAVFPRRFAALNPDRCRLCSLFTWHLPGE